MRAWFVLRPTCQVVLVSILSVVGCLLLVGGGMLAVRQRAAYNSAKFTRESLHIAVPLPRPSALSLSLSIYTYILVCPPIYTPSLSLAFSR